MDAQPRLFSLDNHIYDALTADAAATGALLAAIAAGKLELLETHVLADELTGAPAAVRETAARIPHRGVPTMGMILDVSRLGAARLAEPGPLAAIRGETRPENLTHARDALHLNTARSEGAVFVTEDERLLRRAGREGIPAWPWPEFRRYVVDLIT